MGQIRSSCFHSTHQVGNFSHRVSLLVYCSHIQDIEIWQWSLCPAIVYPNSFRHNRTHSDPFQHIWTHSDTSRLTPTHSNLFGHIPTHLDSFGLIWIYSDSFGHIRTHWSHLDWLGHIRTFLNTFQTNLETFRLIPISITLKF